ncbi:MAG TPA: TerB family tellurite resistance protein [Bryobacteraceae bacterium]|nr:TerB family tellurite resistance protein [Bryobacteraceae bacterium]
MSIRSFLGIPDQHAASADTETVRKVIEALDQMDPARARFIAAFGYILSRVANADLSISPEEVHAMERIIMERGGLPEEQALIVIQTAKTRAQLFGGTENFLVTREFSRIATREEKLALLDCLFAVAAAEGGISATEDNEIRQIVNELGLGHPDFIAVRSRWKDQLNVLKKS